MSILSHTHLSGPFTTLKEFQIIWLHINNDIKDTIAPSLIAFLTAWSYYDSELSKFPLRLGLSLIYAILYILTFCMLNQVNSKEEDAINKPYRPLPAGLTTQSRTWIRIFVYTVLFLALSIYLHIFWVSIGWQIVTYFLNIWGGSTHWITKNWVGMSIGTFLLLAAQWKIAAPGSTPGEGGESFIIFYWIFISLWAGLSLPIQDYRDIEGDRKMNRRTLPLAIGDKKARIFMMSMYLFVLPTIFLAAMLSVRPMQQILRSPVGLIILLGQIAVHWIIAYRLRTKRGARQDDKTYHLYVYLFCALVPTISYLK